MALEMKMNLRLSQQLIMTPQLQQAIKLLQLNHLELVDQIQEELVENPCLEETLETMENPREVPDVKTNEPVDVPEANIDWATYLSRRSITDYQGGYDEEEREQTESILTSTTDLASHLEWQLQVSELDQESKAIGMILIGYINDDGYLGAPLPDICEKEKLDPELTEWVLERIQTFDPTGVGARDLKECLLLQINALGIQDPLVRDLVTNHLADLERHDLKRIAKELDCSVEDVQAGMRIISQLEPKPGRPFTSENVRYIVPDIYITKVGAEFVITQNDDGLPKLKVSNYYKQILQSKGTANKAEQEYIQDKLRSALWLIRSIHQRQRTIYRVTKSIVKHQRDFLEKGIKHLRPMILRDVAEDIEMHESTVSRVTTNKYVHTPQGIFELKYFFNSGIDSDNGDAIASESVKDMIVKIVAEEDPRKPYSDQKIVQLLHQREGLNIARRTVTKYRELLGIASSTKRKRLY